MAGVDSRGAAGVLRGVLCVGGAPWGVGHFSSGYCGPRDGLVQLCSHSCSPTFFLSRTRSHSASDYYDVITAYDDDDDDNEAFTLTLLCL